MLIIIINIITNTTYILITIINISIFTRTRRQLDQQYINPAVHMQIDQPRIRKFFQLVDQDTSYTSGFVKSVD
jgi:hypothetical protein